MLSRVSFDLINSSHVDSKHTYSDSNMLYNYFTRSSVYFITFKLFSSSSRNSSSVFFYSCKFIICFNFSTLSSSIWTSRFRICLFFEFIIEKYFLFSSYKFWLISKMTTKLDKIH